jgi:hypothetical protein
MRVRSPHGRAGAVHCGRRAATVYCQPVGNADKLGNREPKQCAVDRQPVGNADKLAELDSLCRRADDESIRCSDGFVVCSELDVLESCTVRCS